MYQISAMNRQLIGSGFEFLSAHQQVLQPFSAHKVCKTFFTGPPIKISPAVQKMPWRFFFMTMYLFFHVALLRIFFFQRVFCTLKENVGEKKCRNENKNPWNFPTHGENINWYMFMQISEKWQGVHVGNYPTTVLVK